MKQKNTCRSGAALVLIAVGATATSCYGVGGSLLNSSASSGKGSGATTSAASAGSTVVGAVTSVASGATAAKPATSTTPAVTTPATTPPAVTTPAVTTPAVSTGSSFGWSGSVSSVSLKDGAGNHVGSNPIQSFYAMRYYNSGTTTYGPLVAVVLGSQGYNKSLVTTSQPCNGTAAASCTPGDVTISITGCATSGSSCTMNRPLDAFPFSGSKTYDMGYQPTSFSDPFPYPYLSISAQICKAGNTYDTYMLPMGDYTKSPPAYPRSGSSTITGFGDVGGKASLTFTDLKLMSADKSKTLLISGTVSGIDVLAPPPACHN